MTRTQTKNWIILHRRLASDVRSKKLTPHEYLVLVWIKNNTNLYGFAVMSLNDISDDLFLGKKTENAINKILLSLKKKKYLYYEKRSGRRGSFEIKPSDFLLPTGKITTYESISSRTEEDEEKSLEEQKQTLEEEKRLYV